MQKTFKTHAAASFLAGDTVNWPFPGFSDGFR